MDHFSGLEKRALGSGAAAVGATTHAASADRVAEAQHLLADAGHDPGTRSGQLDAATREAIGRFQRSRGLPVTKTVDSQTHAALTSSGSNPSLASSSPRPRAFPQSPTGRLPPRSNQNMGSGKVWKGTPKRVPVIFAQANLAAATSNTLAITPSWPFRGENLVIDGTTGALCTVQIPSVGPNPQVAGGTPSTNIPGTAFPPTQTDCVRMGFDISEQGNQLSLTYTNSQTSLTLNFVAMVLGTVVEEASDSDKQAMARTGISMAGNYIPHTALAPAMSYVR